MRASRWSFTRGQRCRLRIDRHCGACPSFSCFLHHFTELGEMPLSALSSDRGVGREDHVASGEDVCSMTHWWHIWASEISRGWLWGLHRFSGMRTISFHTYNEQWGQKVTLLTAFRLPKKINSLLELNRHQRRNGTALKWRQKTFTFVRYDYRCSLVSLLLLQRNFSGSVPLSLAGPLLFLLLIWTSCSLSLDSSLPGCWFYFCPLLQAIHSAYCACTDETHIWNTCF